MTYGQFVSPKAESSADIRKRVTAARKLQAERLKEEGVFCNAQISKDVEKYCVLTSEAARMAKDAFSAMGMSIRGYTRVLKVARTIADLDGSEKINEMHIAEAVRYHLPQDRLSV